MACFLVSATEAVLVTVVKKAIESKEKVPEEIQVKFEGNTLEKGTKIRFTEKLKWLGNMLWGGSALLAFEHVWHGEVVPWFPFLTAASNPADAAEMLQEMSTVGVSMALLVTGVWGIMVWVTAVMEKSAQKPIKA